MSSPVDEEKIASDLIDLTFNEDTADFCARELAKSQKMQQNAAKDKHKTATLLASITPSEQEAIETFKLAVADESSSHGEFSSEETA